jgi:very-short-patch-repair endonuclease
MNKTYNKKLIGNARQLRRNMTKEERHLWYDFLILLPVTVNRQKVIGQYIVDFYCASAKTVIEIDGTQHYLDAGKEKDAERDAYFNSLGIVVLRYSNFDVNRKFDAVCNDIYNHVIK